MEIKKTDREIRYGVLTREENAPQEDEKYFHIDGKAVCFNEKTLLYPAKYFGLDQDVYETMDPKCLDEADMSDVVLNVNHGDGNHAVARTRNKTLTFEKKGDGLYIHALLDKENPRCAQFYRDVSEGLLDRMSFAFIIGEQDFDEETSTITVRKIDRLFDVSAVEHPQYEGTSISASRSEDLDKLRNEMESRKALEKAKAEAIAKAEYILKGE